MAGLVPAIHAVRPHECPRVPRLSVSGQLEAALLRIGVDGRDKPGHDGIGGASVSAEGPGLGVTRPLQHGLAVLGEFQGVRKKSHRKDQEIPPQPKELGSFRQNGLFYVCCLYYSQKRRQFIVSSSGLTDRQDNRAPHIVRVASPPAWGPRSRKTRARVGSVGKMRAIGITSP